MFRLFNYHLYWASLGCNSCNHAQCVVLSRYVINASSVITKILMFGREGAFENPLCCPCYLCACCGGLGMSFFAGTGHSVEINNLLFLACLECIGCGLCAEAAEV